MNCKKWFEALSRQLSRGTRKYRRSQWPRGLRRDSATVSPLELQVRFPLWAWMSVSIKCCGLSGLSSDHSSGAVLPRVGVPEYYLETSTMRRLRPISSVEPWKNKLRNIISWFQPKTMHTLRYLNSHVKTRYWNVWLAWF
jgi:hypothetical protein